MARNRRSDRRVLRGAFATMISAGALAALLLGYDAQHCKSTAGWIRLVAIALGGVMLGPAFCYRGDIWMPLEFASAPTSR